MEVYQKCVSGFKLLNGGVYNTTSRLATLFEVTPANIFVPQPQITSKRETLQFTLHLQYSYQEQKLLKKTDVAATLSSIVDIVTVVHLSSHLTPWLDIRPGIFSCWKIADSGRPVFNKSCDLLTFSMRKKAFVSVFLQKRHIKLQYAQECTWINLRS